MTFRYVTSWAAYPSAMLSLAGTLFLVAYFSAEWPVHVKSPPPAPIDGRERHAGLQTSVRYGGNPLGDVYLPRGTGASPAFFPVSFAALCFEFFSSKRRYIYRLGRALQPLGLGKQARGNLPLFTNKRCALTDATGAVPLAYRALHFSGCGCFTP